MKKIAATIIALMAIMSVSAQTSMKMDFNNFKWTREPAKCILRHASHRMCLEGTRWSATR